MAQDWYWTKGQQRFGPVPVAELVGRLRDGTVSARDMVWTESMPEWRPAGSLPALASDLAGGPAVAAVEVPVGYFNPSAGLPPRATAALSGHATPAGDVATWPLDDAQVAQFRQAFALRQKVLQSANLSKLLLALNAIGSVVLLLVGVFGLLGGGHGASAGATVSLVIGVMTGGFAALFWLTWLATLRSKRWAPITVTCLLSVNVIFTLGSTVVGGTSTRGGDQPAFVVAAIITLVVGGIFIVVAAKAIGAIPAYLRLPAWCQELLSQTKA